MAATCSGDMPWNMDGEMAGSGAGVRQFLAQGNAVGLAINGFVDRRFLRLWLSIGGPSGGD